MEQKRIESEKNRTSQTQLDIDQFQVNDRYTIHIQFIYIATNFILLY
jgi:hypothetical protein